eukprot:scaffold53048_cov60-Phaeocystis_antarctica.AAC.2
MRAWGSTQAVALPLEPERASQSCLPGSSGSTSSPSVGTRQPGPAWPAAGRTAAVARCPESVCSPPGAPLVERPSREECQPKGGRHLNVNGRTARAMSYSSAGESDLLVATTK